MIFWTPLIFYVQQIIIDTINNLQTEPFMVFLISPHFLTEVPMNRFIKFTKNDFLSIVITVTIFMIFAFSISRTHIFDSMENSAINFLFFPAGPFAEGS